MLWLRLKFAAILFAVALFVASIGTVNLITRGRFDDWPVGDSYVN